MSALGVPYGLLTPQMSATAAAAVTAGGNTVRLTGTSLAQWLVAGTEIALEQQEDAVVTGFTTVDGNLVVSLAAPVLSSHPKDSLVTVTSFPALVLGDISTGDASPFGVVVQVESPFMLVPGDTIRISGSRYTLDRVTDNGDGTYGVGVTNLNGIPESPTGTTVTVIARPAYQSQQITLPTQFAESFIRGPVALDVVAGPVVAAESTPAVNLLLHVEEYDSGGRTILPFTQTPVNGTLSRIPIGTDQFLFWNIAEGRLQWNGSKTLLMANPAGRVHLWTPCRPNLNAAPPTRLDSVVPLFAPYRVLLNTDVIPELSVRLEDGSLVDPTLYSVDPAIGNVDFSASLSGTAVQVTYRPRLSWATVVVPSEANLEMVVRFGNEAKVVVPLGAANTPQVVTLPVQTDSPVFDVHITVRRPDDSGGAFSVALSDWTPRGRHTAAIRYIISTSADVDYEWLASGMIVKPLWPTLDLLRARLDGEGTLAQALDNGRMLL